MSKPKSTNVVWQTLNIDKKARDELLQQKGVTLWFTGLPSSGKSTISNKVAEVLHEKGYLTYVLDGDNIRHGLNGDLGFSADDRIENIRRIGEVAKLFTNTGIITMTAFVSPYRSDRQKARDLVDTEDFIEVYVKCPVEVCEERDPKGLYKKAREGKIPEYTGVSAPYEEPENPEVVVDTAAETLEESAKKVIAYLEQRGVIGLK